MRRFEKGAAEKRRAGRRMHGGFDTGRPLFICDEKHLLKHEKFTLRASAIAVTRGASLLSNGRCGSLCTIGPGCSSRWGVDTSFRRDCIQNTGCACLAREATESLWYLPLPKMCMRGACFSSLHSLTVSVIITRC